MLQASEFGLFFVFSALNLVWFVLRNISIAFDDFLYFESLEAIRRCAHIAVLLAMLIGLPLLAFVVLANLIWAALIAMSVRRLMARGALSGSFRGVPNCLRVFFRRNRSELLRSGSFAASELYIYNCPYMLVPLAFGLGAPTIVLDTTFKIFRGAALIYSVGCDIAVPRQTRAFAEGDAVGLVRVTLLAFAVAALPTAIVCALLYFGADRIFALLLGHAVTMPIAAGPILIVLMAANIVQNFSTSLMIHTGFFRDMSRLAIFMAVLLTIVCAGAITAGLDIVGFLIAYTCVYVVGAIAFLALALYGPIQSARAKPAQA
jgi:O-antigen/teichoic acid export membrane protein